MSEVPPGLAPLIGRVEELEQLAELSDQHALVTLIGAPGIGKSRLALALAQRASNACYLDALELSGAEELSSRLEELARRHALVVLDGFETLVSEGAAAVRDASASAHLVVASRQRLRLASECVFELGPLACQPPDAAAEADAVVLLEARLRLGQAHWAPDAAERASMRRLVEGLEGNPLAIELAAARVPALSLDDLLARLPNLLDILSRGPRDSDARTASLRGAIDWSWRLLDAEQQRMLARCSVFAASFSLAAAEAVLGAGALDSLQDLMERSLVRSVSAGRYALYSPVRAFAAEQLERLGESQRMRARHREFFLPLASQEAAAFSARGAPFEQLERERHEVVEALQRALDDGVADAAIDGVTALGALLGVRGPVELHRDLLERALVLRPGEPRLLCARGAVRRSLADLTGAQADLEAALEQAADDDVKMTSYKELGTLHQLKRDFEAARSCYEAALPLARGRVRRMEAALVANLGALDHDAGCFELAAQRYGEALDLLREVGDKRLEAIALTNLGVLEQEQGGHERARRCYKRALALLAEVEDPRFEAVTLGNLGVLEHEQGDLEAALACHRRALPLLQRMGVRRSEALCLARLGAVLASADRLEEADEAFDAAERITLGRDPLGRSLVQLHRCFVDLARGEEAAAYARLEAAQAPGDDGSASLVEVSDDARMVLRMLSQPLSTGDGPRLKVGPEALWFKPPGGGRQDLSKFAAARRILDCLAEQRLAQPGKPLAGDALFRAGWPDVNISAGSAANRLHVQLAKLRKLGLKLVLLRSDEGYFLDPHTPLIRELEP